MFCQGELFLSRPDAAGLTDFYLVIAAGGAAGAIFIGIFAPYLFEGIYELPFTLLRPRCWCWFRLGAITLGRCVALGGSFRLHGGGVCGRM